MTSLNLAPLDAAQLYDRYVERIYRYHLARTGCPAEAEDLTSETFRAALEGLDRCRPEQAAAWLVGIARHKQADQLRRSGRVVSLEALLERAAPPPAVEDQAGILNRTDEGGDALGKVVDGDRQGRKHPDAQQVRVGEVMVVIGGMVSCLINRRLSPPPNRAAGRKPAFRGQR
jgi:RNA polymerase sigma factor (sigma-70 family)